MNLKVTNFGLFISTLSRKMALLSGAIGFVYGASGLGMANSANRLSQPVGFNLSAPEVGAVDFYLTKTALGYEIKSRFEQYSELRKKPLNNLPIDFNPILDRIHNYVLEFSEQENEKSEFYVGANGSLNGPEFDFDRYHLPTKLLKLSFCFGFDPLIFTGLVRQESHFSRNAKSHTAASGFTQMTGSGITEVVEQLGITSPDLHNPETQLHFETYIQCYLGTEKTWINPWDDGIIPKGRDAYLNGSIKEERRLRNIDKLKKWLNEDPDRNLIFGAILFKTHLARKGSYDLALKEYNVGQPTIYTGKVGSAYRAMAQKVRNQDVTEQNPGRTFVNMDFYVYNFKNYICRVPVDDADSGFPENVLSVVNGFFSTDESEQLAQSFLIESRYCQEKATYL